MPVFWLNDAWLPAVSVSIGMIRVPVAKLLFAALPLLAENTASIAQSASPTNTKRSGVVSARTKFMKPLEAIDESLDRRMDDPLIG